MPVPHPKVADIWGPWSPQETPYNFQCHTPLSAGGTSKDLGKFNTKAFPQRNGRNEPSLVFQTFAKKMVEKSVCFLKLNHFLMSWQSKGTSPRPYFLGGVLLGSHDDAKLFVWIINRLILFFRWSASSLSKALPRLHGIQGQWAHAQVLGMPQH